MLYLHRPPPTRLILTCGLSMSLLAACSGAEPDQGAQQDANLLARVELEGGSVSFYEPEPGTVVEEQVGRIADPVLEAGHDLSFTQRYELLSGKPAPAALVVAEKRADAEAPPTTAREEVNFADGQRANVEKGGTTAPSEEWFLATYCQHEDRFWGSPDWTGDSWWEGSGLNYLKAGVMVVAGEIVYRFTWTGNRTGDEYTDIGDLIGVTPGKYVGHRVKSAVNRSGSSNVTYAEGDHYHHCVNFHF